MSLSEFKIPTSTSILSMKPIVLPASYRGIDLQLKVSFPNEGHQLPIILLAHGFGSSMEGYGPLADFYASHGFIVIQPTFLDSRTINLDKDDKRQSELWRYRVQNMKNIIDHLNQVTEEIPTLHQRIDKDNIAVVGHSFGGQTAGNLLGLQVFDPLTNSYTDYLDSRVKGGILLATASEGGDKLTQFAKDNFPFLNPTFKHMSKPALIIAGDKDDSPLTQLGPEWMEEPYYLSPGKKSLLKLYDAEHSLGGIAGYEVKETTDENPERVSLVQYVTWAYLRSLLDIEHDSWNHAQSVLDDKNAMGIIQSKMH